MTLEKEIFPAATDSRFIRAVSKRTGYDRRDTKKKSLTFDFLLIYQDTLLGKSCSTPSVLCNRCICWICRWVSLQSAFPQWTGRQSCCTITTSTWTSKSSWKASACSRGSSQLLPAFLPFLMRLRQVLILILSKTNFTDDLNI